VLDFQKGVGQDILFQPSHLDSFLGPPSLWFKEFGGLSAVVKATGAWRW